MKLIALKQGAVYLQHGEQRWLFGAPKGVAENITELGLELPSVVFTTTLKSPGKYELAALDNSFLSFKELPLGMSGLTATPLPRKHGTDYEVVADDARILVSERGDVSVKDTQGYDLAIIKNKHSAGFGEHVHTWPWQDAEFKVQAHTLIPSIGNITYKVWSDMEDVPTNLKKMDGVPLTLAQANFIARVAEASADGPDENFAIGIAAFKKSYQKQGNSWIRKNKEEIEPPESLDEDTTLKEMVPMTDGMPSDMEPRKRFGDIITAAMHTAYNDTADFYFAQGYLSQDERMAVAHSVGPALDALRSNLPNEVMERDVTYCEIPHKFKELAPNVPDYITQDGWFNVYKQDDNWRWAAISSIADWDEQGELFTTKAMDWAIAFSKIIGTKGPLRFKHVPGLDGGSCDTQVRVNDVLFEGGAFQDNAVGLAMRKRWKEEPNKWQVSLGLAYAEGDIVDGRYQRAAIFERSMTEKPANKKTAFYVIKENEMPAMLGEEQLRQAAEQLGMELSEVKMMYERAIAAGNVMGLKEFETALKENGAGGQNAAKPNKDDEEEPEESLKEVLLGMETDELVDVLNTLKEVIVFKADDSEEEDDEEDEMEMEVEVPMKKSKKEDDDRVSRLEELVMYQTKAMTQMVQALAGGRAPAAPSTSDKLGGFITQTSQKQATQATDNEVLAKLKEIEEKLKQQDGGNAFGGDFYNSFTSTELNRKRQ